MDAHDQETQQKESCKKADRWGNSPSEQRESKRTNHSCWTPTNHSGASCFIRFRLTRRPHHLMKKTSSMQSKRRVSHPKWLHRETNDKSLLLLRLKRLRDVFKLKFKSSHMPSHYNSLFSSLFQPDFTVLIIFKKEILNQAKNILQA